LNKEKKNCKGASKKKREVINYTTKQALLCSLSRDEMVCYTPR
jgi:hypothetical protein